LASACENPGEQGNVTRDPIQACVPSGVLITEVAGPEYFLLSFENGFPAVAITHSF
jgi:hypothetical protein